MYRKGGRCMFYWEKNKDFTILIYLYCPQNLFSDSLFTLCFGLPLTLSNSRVRERLSQLQLRSALMGTQHSSARVGAAHFLFTETHIRKLWKSHMDALKLTTTTHGQKKTTLNDVNCLKDSQQLTFSPAVMTSPHVVETVLLLRPCPCGIYSCSSYNKSIAFLVISSGHKSNFMWNLLMLTTS